MRIFAVLSSLLGIALLIAGFVRFYGVTRIMGGGNITLFTLGSIALFVGLVTAIAGWRHRERVTHNRNHP